MNVNRMTGSGSIHSTDDTFEQDVLHSDLPVLVDFYADWCGPCKIVAPTVEELSQEYDGKVRFVKVDVDGSSAIAGNYGIMSIPTLAIFKEGKVVDKLVGAASKSHLRKMIDKVL